MQRIPTFLISCLLLGSMGLQAEERETHEFLKGVKTYLYRLDNGLTLVITPNPLAPRTSVIHWVKAGSLHERKGITGIAHLFEHMMFRPLKGSTKQFFEDVSDLGGSVDANTRYGATVFSSQSANENVNELLKRESARFKTMVVTDETLKIEREAVRSEYAVKLDAMPLMDQWFTLFQKAYEGHPFGWNVVGFREDLDHITAKDCNEFFERYYKASNVGLFIAGNFNLEAVEKTVRAAYGDWPAGVKTSLPPAYAAKTQYISAEGKLEAASNDFLLGFRIPYPSPADSPKMILAKYILLGSQRDWLNQRLVFQDKLASQVRDLNTDYDWGMFEFIISLTPGVTPEQIVTQLEKVPDDIAKLPEQDYQAYIKELQDSTAEGLLTNEDFNNKIAFSWGKFGDIKMLPSLIQKAPAVTKEELADWLRPIFRKSNATVVVGKKASGGQK